MGERMTECPLCGAKEAQAKTVSSELREQTWNCFRCGAFVTRRSLSLTNEQQRILRGLVMERQLRGEGPLTVTPDNLETLLAQGPSTVAEQADRLLVNLAKKSSEPPVMTSLSSNLHGALAFSGAIDGFVAWLDLLRREELIDLEGSRKNTPNDLAFRLTIRGWRRVEELDRAGAQSDAGFVAMPFHPDLEPVWLDGIQPAFKEAGWRPIRADKVQHNERIDDWIVNQIRASRFVVADTTGSNAGACFEAGLAIGHRKPVIWVAQEGFTGLHFDIRQYNHLAWKPGSEALLCPALAERIMATIGRGPLTRSTL